MCRFSRLTSLRGVTEEPYGMQSAQPIKEFIMPKVSAKRQITIPIDLCEKAHLKPGDDIEAFLYKGQITLVKKGKFAAKGILAHIQSDKNMSDESSLEDALNTRH